MAALCNRADHYIFALLFLSIYLLFFLAYLSGRRLDVYHTLTHGVDLVRIWNAGVKGAARGSLQMQDPKKSPKNHHLGTIAQLSPAISLELRHVSTIGKILLSSNISPHIYLQYRELRPTRG